MKKNLTLCYMILLATFVFTQSIKASMNARDQVIAVELLKGETNILSSPLQTIPEYTAEGFVSVDAVPRDKTVRCAVEVDIPEGIHTNAASPMKITVSSSSKINIGSVIYPPAKRQVVDYDGSKLNVYEGHIVFFFDITVPKTTRLGKTTITAVLSISLEDEKVDYVPRKKVVEIPLNIVAANAKSKKINQQVFDSDSN